MVQGDLIEDTLLNCISNSKTKSLDMLIAYTDFKHLKYTKNLILAKFDPFFVKMSDFEYFCLTKLGKKFLILKAAVTKIWVVLKIIKIILVPGY